MLRRAVRRGAKRLARHARAEEGRRRRAREVPSRRGAHAADAAPPARRRRHRGPRAHRRRGGGPARADVPAAGRQGAPRARGAPRPARGKAPPAQRARGPRGGQDRRTHVPRAALRTRRVLRRPPHARGGLDDGRVADVRRHACGGVAPGRRHRDAADVLHPARRRRVAGRGEGPRPAEGHAELPSRRSIQGGGRRHARERRHALNRGAARPPRRRRAARAGRKLRHLPHSRRRRVARRSVPSHLDAGGHEARPHRRRGPAIRHRPPRDADRGRDGRKAPEGVGAQLARAGAEAWRGDARPRGRQLRALLQRDALRGRAGADGRRARARGELPALGLQGRGPELHNDPEQPTSGVVRGQPARLAGPHRLRADVGPHARLHRRLHQLREAPGARRPGGRDHWARPPQRHRAPQRGEPDRPARQLQRGGARQVGHGQDQARGAHGPRGVPSLRDQAHHHRPRPPVHGPGPLARRRGREDERVVFGEALAAAAARHLVLGGRRRGGRRRGCGPRALHDHPVRQVVPGPRLRARPRGHGHARAGARAGLRQVRHNGGDHLRGVPRPRHVVPRHGRPLRRAHRHG